MTTWLDGSISKLLSLFFEAADFLFKKSSFLLTFLLMAEGLSFFLTTSLEVELTLVSREKEKLDPIFREKVNGQRSSLQALGSQGRALSCHCSLCCHDRLE